MPFWRGDTFAFVCRGAIGTRQFGAGGHQEAVPISVETSQLSPGAPCRIRDELQLAALLVPTQQVALLDRGEATLRADRQIFHRHVLRRFVDAPQQVVLFLQRAEFGGHQSEYDLFAFRNEAEWLEAAGAI